MGIEVVQQLTSLAGAFLGGAGAIFWKEYREKRGRRDLEIQTRWLPLCSAAFGLRTRLYTLCNEYSIHTRRDLMELYMLKRDVNPSADIESLVPNERGSNRSIVQEIRSRIHYLNFATSSLYITARYLGYAHRTTYELEMGQLAPPAGIDRKKIMDRLSSVRKELHGSGVGIVDDLQDLIGECVWNEGQGVVGYYPFRERLLADVGWEQFAELFRFFIDFEKKCGYEAKKTYQALCELEQVLLRVVSPDAEREYCMWPKA